MKYPLSGLVFFALLVSSGMGTVHAATNDSLPAALRRFGDTALTRAEVLAWSTAYFFDEVQWDGVKPSYNGTVIGIAQKTGAMDVWGSNAAATLGSEVTSRCQAIEVIFRMISVRSGTSGTTGFRDVVALKDRQNIQQAIAWEMIQPLGKAFFGCRRSLRATELATMLEQIGERVTLPIHLPKPKQNTNKSPSGGSVRIRRNPSSQPSSANGNESQVESGEEDATAFPHGDILGAVWQILQEKYLYMDTVDRDNLGFALAEALAAGMNDPYTTFMRPKRAKAFQESLQGELSGIGAQVEAHAQGGVLVISPLSGSPAMNAGVHPGDRIVAVDEKDILKFNLQDAVDLIRGPAGTSVKLLIERGGAKITITVVRAQITVPEVELEIQENVGVVKIMQFGQITRTDLGPVLQKALQENVKGIVLDLRNDPGGYLETAIDVLGHFLPKDTVVAQIKDKALTNTSATRRAEQIVPASMPVVVLVNKGSASASEIVAGALQDLGRATVVGTQTFGKGTVQEIFDANGKWSIKFTIAEWLTPLGRSIQGEGIAPDIIVEDSRTTGGRDEQLLRAIQIVQGNGS